VSLPLRANRDYSNVHADVQMRDGATAIWRMPVDFRDISLRYIYPYITKRPIIPRFPTDRKLAQ
jgi:hypothetical protein